jgi:hypothetical protein
MVGIWEGGRVMEEQNSDDGLSEEQNVDTGFLEDRNGEGGVLEERQSGDDGVFHVRNDDSGLEDRNGEYGDLDELNGGDGGLEGQSCNGSDDANTKTEADVCPGGNSLSDHEMRFQSAAAEGSIAMERGHDAAESDDQRTHPCPGRVGDGSSEWDDSQRVTVVCWKAGCDVGPAGKVFNDILGFGEVSHSQLTFIYRQLLALVPLGNGEATRQERRAARPMAKWFDNHYETFNGLLMEMHGMSFSHFVHACTCRSGFPE